MWVRCTRHVKSRDCIMTAVLRSTATYCAVLRSYVDVFAALIAPVSIFAARRCAALLYYAFCVNALVDLHVFNYSVSTQCSAVRRSTAMHCAVLRAM